MLPRRLRLKALVKICHDNLPRNEPNSKVRCALTSHVQIGPALEVVSFESGELRVIEIVVTSKSPNHEKSWERICRDA